LLTFFNKVGGVETLDDSLFLIYVLEMLYLIASSMDLNYCYRPISKLSMKGNASIAVPSVTSIAIKPLIQLLNSSSCSTA